MRLAAAVLALLAAAGAAHAEPMPYDGRWGWDAAACRIRPGEGDGVPTVIGNGRIDYYESTCTIERSEPVGNGSGFAWRVKLACGGEGETWTSESIFAIEDRGDERARLWIDIDLNTGFAITRIDCDWKGP